MEKLVQGKTGSFTESEARNLPLNYMPGRENQKSIPALKL